MQQGIYLMYMGFIHKLGRNEEIIEMIQHEAKELERVRMYK